MNILAFDTSFDACSVAAGRGLRSLSPVIAANFEPMAQGHAERLLPMIETALAETGLSTGLLDRIAVTSGPGTFTGARIGVAAARALALVHKTPIVAISSLKLMAMNYRALATDAGELAVATDARRGEVYIERFDPRDLKSKAPPAALSIAAAANSLSEISVAVAGSGAEAVAAAARQIGKDARAVATDLLPDAADMLFAAMKLLPAANVEPLYLRPPDAKPPSAGKLAVRFSA